MLERDFSPYLSKTGTGQILENRGETLEKRSVLYSTLESGWQKDYPSHFRVKHSKYDRDTRSPTGPVADYALIE